MKSVDEEEFIDLLIVEPYILAHHGIQVFMQQHFMGKKIVIVKDCLDLNNIIRQKQPNVLIIALTSSATDDNFDVMRQIHATFPDLRIIIYDEQVRTYECIQALKQNNIQGYILKTDKMEELFSCIEAVFSSQLFICKTISEKLTANIISQCGPFHEVELSKREHQVASLLCKGVAPNLIAQTLALKPTTISTYKSRIFSKLGVNNDVGLYNARKAWM